MNIGLFGGSFNPVHLGHLLLAETCREACQLDQVLFMPAAVPPHKQDQKLADAKHRLEMLQLAIAGNSSFVVSDLELQRGGTSYTVDTLRTLHQQAPQNQYFLLMGADSLDDFPNWREPAQICELAIPIVVRRRGAPPVDVQRLAHLLPSALVDTIAGHQIDSPTIEISSTELRDRIALGRSTRYRLPRAVEAYIEAHRLYRTRKS